jgi:serine/threonine protein kinase
MVCGDIPFETDSQIKKASLYFREGLGLSEELKDLIRQCLNVASSERITLAKLAEHPWLKTRPEAEAVRDRPVLQRTISAPVNVVIGNNTTNSNSSIVLAAPSSSAAAASSNNNPVMKDSPSSSSMETVDISAAEDHSLGYESGCFDVQSSSPFPGHVAAMFDRPLTQQRNVAGSCDDDSCFDSSTPMSISPSPFSGCQQRLHDEACLSLSDQLMASSDLRTQLPDVVVDSLQDPRFLTSQLSCRSRQLQQLQKFVLPPFHELANNRITARM